ncbi:MAG TPA: hypothetical protein EYN66_11205 [Myxococcales bacterium]|nr:hypothetical protein [Myxococcales bacterium]
MKRLLLLLVLIFTLTVTAATAGDASVVLCFPGGPGSTADAQPVVDRFMAQLSKEMGWKDAKGVYFNQMSTCKHAYKDHAATLVMVPLNVYLEVRTSWKLNPIVLMNNKESSGQFHVITKTASCSGCLKGQTVTTGLKMSNNFLSRVAFDGKLQVGKGFTLKRTRSPIRAIKSVLKDKAIAAIVNDAQRRSLKGLPGTEEINTIISGPKLPGAIVASVGKPAPALKKVLLGLCKAQKELCKEMRITGFGKVDSARLKSLEEKLK